MRKYNSDIAFTPKVKSVQEKLGSRQIYERAESEREWSDEVTYLLRNFIESQDMFYFATSTAEGQPYIQYKGGPQGFLKVLDDKTLAWADFAGNKQYISYGNLEENDKAFIFLIDYVEGRRFKLWGKAEVVEDDPAIMEQLVDPAYAAKPERAVVFHLEAWDANCPKHIHRRFNEDVVETLFAEKSEKIARLEAEVAALKAKAN